MTNGPTKIYVGGWVMEGKSNFGSNHGWKNYKLEDRYGRVFMNMYFFILKKGNWLEYDFN